MPGSKDRHTMDGPSGSVEANVFDIIGANTRLMPPPNPEQLTMPSHVAIEHITGEEPRISDDDPTETADAESIIGVSISREQSRLLLSSTPAAEKLAALDRMNASGSFAESDEEVQQGVLFNTLQKKDTLDSPTPSVNVAPDSSQLQMDRATRRASESLQDGSKTLVPGEEGCAPRSRNAFAGFLGDFGLKRFFSTLNPNPFSDTSKSIYQSFSSFGSMRIESSDLPSPRLRSKSVFLSKIPWGSMMPRPDSNTDTMPGGLTTFPPTELSSKARIPDAPAGKGAARVLSLRRSVSDNSLIKPAISRQSTLSETSMLGDERDWTNTKQQINSRSKAIRDTLHTSLPQIPSIDLSALRPNLAARMLREPEKLLSRAAVAAEEQQVRPDGKLSPRVTQPRLGSPPKMLHSRSPSFDMALEQLTGDVVVMGGYRGSILRAAEEPYRQLWVPLKVGLGVRKVNLEVGLNPEDEENMHQQIIPSGMLTHIGPVDMSRRLLKRLRSSRNAKNGSLRVWDYGYDWRLSPSLLSRRLIQFLERLQCNKDEKCGATIIAHSLGGLITRHAVNQCPVLFGGVLYVGTPQHCVNILGPLRNGDDVFLTSRVLTAQVNFTFRTSFLLLPESGHCFVNKDTQEQYHVDFFDAENWKHYALSPCIATPQPSYSPVERKSIFSTLTNSIPSFITYNSLLTNLQNLGSSLSPLPPPDNDPEKVRNVVHPTEGTVGMQMSSGQSQTSACTIPFPEAMRYLQRTLAETLRFKMEMRHNADLEARNQYPPHALIYGTSMPTVYGARVACRDAIKHSDAYDNLSFASGDGVVLARAALMPRGYKTVARVRTKRGHVSMMGDLEAVGQCLLQLMRARREGVGSCILEPQRTPTETE